MNEIVVTVGDRNIRDVHRDIQKAASANGHVFVEDTRSRHNLGVALPAGATLHFEAASATIAGD